MGEMSRRVWNVAYVVLQQPLSAANDGGTRCSRHQRSAADAHTTAEESRRPRNPPRGRRAGSSSTLWLLGVLALVLMFLVCNHQLGGVSEISYGMFREQLDKSPPNIAKVEVQGTAVTGEFVTPPPDPSGKKDRNGHDVMLERKFVTSLPAGALADRHLDDLLLEKVGDDYTVVAGQRRHADDADVLRC